MLCDDEYIESNPQIKTFLEENCPNTCGYCSKFILDIAARLIQLHGACLQLCVSGDPKKDTHENKEPNNRYRQTWMTMKKFTFYFKDFVWLD